jgi:hypothetical protein
MHCLPQLPQLLAFPWSSTQLPAHNEKPGLHAQAPPGAAMVGAQYWRELQCVPQVPQWAGSSVMSRHEPPPPHTVEFAGQLHALVVHDANCAHALPHIPQFAGSFVRFAHTGPAPLGHMTSGAPHVHMPPVQVSPAPHWVKQLPQWFGSVEVLMH